VVSDFAARSQRDDLRAAGRIGARGAKQRSRVLGQLRGTRRLRLGAQVVVASGIDSPDHEPGV
jgi:hypothetical protein